MKDIVLHVGFPRCASTFLQTKIFNSLKHVGYVSNKNNAITKNCLDRIRSFDPVNLDLPIIRDAILGEVNRQPQHAVVISNEGLVGDSNNNFSNHTGITQCLKRIFPEARVLVVIRRQDELAQSLYSLYISKGGTQSYDRYLYCRAGRFMPYGKYFSDRPPYLIPKASLNIQSLDFRPYVKSYIEHFGMENLTVVPFELLRENAERFVVEVCRMFPDAEMRSVQMTEVNPSLTPKGIKYARFLNHFVREEENLLGVFPLKSGEARGLKKIWAKRFRSLRNFYYAMGRNNKEGIFPKELMKAIINEFRHANEQLDRDHCLNLSQFGYY